MSAIRVHVLDVLALWLVPQPSSGRPVTGFARPGTQTSRPMTGNRPGTMSMRQALQSR